MACICFDFCNGALSCTDGDYTDDWRNGTCGQLCHSQGKGFAKSTHFRITNSDGQTMRQATCAEITGAPQLMYIEPGGVRFHYFWTGCGEGYQLWEPSNFQVHWNPGIIEGVAVPLGKTPFDMYPPVPTGSAIYHYDAGFALTSLGTVDGKVYWVGFVEPVAGWKLRPEYANEAFSLCGIGPCCGGCTPSEVPHSSQHAPWAYAHGRSCFEPGSMAITQGACSYKPCCRRGVQSWPPFPQTFISDCDLRDVNIPTNATNACNNVGHPPNEGYLNRNTFARSCFFPNVCNGGNGQPCTTGAECGPIPTNTCHFFCMGPGFRDGQPDEEIISLQPQAVQGFGVNIVGDTAYSSAADCVPISCRVGALSAEYDNMYVDADGDDVFIGAIYA